MTGLTGTVNYCRDFITWDAHHASTWKINSAQAWAGTESMATPSKGQLSC
ncbi:hypothetical protein NRF20_42770 [Streptomyces sp. R-74717]